MNTMPVDATTPEALARTLGLTGAQAHEWQVQHALLERLLAAVGYRVHVSVSPMDSAA